jgi:hypothetical protein
MVIEGEEVRAFALQFDQQCRRVFCGVDCDRLLGWLRTFRCLTNGCYRGGTGILKIGKALGIGTGTVQRIVMEQPRPFDVAKRLPHSETEAAASMHSHEAIAHLLDHLVGGRAAWEEW